MLLSSKYNSNLNCNFAAITVVNTADDCEALQEPTAGKFGLKHSDGIPCLLLHFTAKIFESESNSTWIVWKVCFVA